MDWLSATEASMVQQGTNRDATKEDKGNSLQDLLYVPGIVWKYYRKTMILKNKGRLGGWILWYLCGLALALAAVGYEISFMSNTVTTFRYKYTAATNQNSLFRSNDWLSANQGLAFPSGIKYTVAT